MQKGTVDSGQEIIGSNLVLNIDAAQKRSFPAGLPQVATSGLVLNLDAGNAASYPGTGTTWNDLSGNSNTGTLVNGPTFDSSNGGSIVFDGTNDYGQIAHTTLLNPTLSMTLSAWINVSSFVPFMSIFGKGTLTNGSGGFDFRIDSSTSLNLVKYFIIDQGVTISALSTNTWYNIVAVQSSTKVDYYINGVNVGSFSNSNAYQTNTAVFKIAADRNSAVYTPAKIANVQIYNRVLSATEVFDNFNATKSRFGYTSISTSGLQLSLDAGDANSYIGSGTFWTDLTANGNNGTLVNGPTFNSANGGSIYTDGVDDYVVTSSSGGSATDSYTFSVWFKNDNYSEDKFILLRGRDGSGNGWSLWLRVYTNGKAEAGAVPTSPSVVGLFATGTSTLALNTWYYITGVWVPNGTLKVYVNGVLETTVSTSGYTNLRTSTVGWVLGSLNTGTFTSGYTAIVQVYNRELSASEVLDTYNSQKNRFITTPTWFDISGNNNNGVLTNGPIFTFGNGGFMSLDGTNDYINAGNINLQTSWTLEIWAYMNNSSAFGLFGQGILNTNQGLHIYYTNGARGMVFGMYSNDNDYQNNYRPSTLQWYNWVFTYNGSTYAKQFYANGVLQTPAVSTQNVYQGSGQFNIGANYSIPNQFANGRIALSRVYNRVLSATEVLNNFDAVRSRFGLAAPIGPRTIPYEFGTAQLVFDFSSTANYSNSGTSIADLSGNTNNGTFSKGTGNGSATTVTGYSTNGYLNLPGSSAQLSVRIPDALKPGGTANFTYIVYMRPKGYSYNGGFPGIISMVQDSGGTGFTWHLQNVSPVGQVSNRNNTNYVNLAYSGGAGLNVWSVYAVKFDGVSTTLYQYYNGNLYTSNTVGAPSVITSTSWGIFLGLRYNMWINADFNYVAMYNTALSNADITTIAQNLVTITPV